MRPGGLAAVGEVRLLVHMETVLGARLAKILDVPGDSDGVGVGLLEGDDAGAGLLRLGSIARLAIGPNNERRFKTAFGETMNYLHTIGAKPAPTKCFTFSTSFDPIGFRPSGSSTSSNVPIFKRSPIRLGRD